MATRKTTKGTSTQFTAFMADLGSKIRFDSNNLNSLSFGFVLDKGLQLIETPVANPIVHSFSSSLFSNSFEVFHYNLVAFKVGNNAFADIVVNPSHKPLLSSRNLLEKSFGTSSAFGLKSGAQEFEPSFNLFDFGRIEKLAIGSDCQVIYSEINAKNLLVRDFDMNLFRKTEKKETPILFIDSEQTFVNLPLKILFVAIRDKKWDFDSSFNSGQIQNIISERSTTRKVVSYACSVNNGLRLGFFDNSTSLFDASDGKLSRESLFKMCIDKRVQFDIILNFSLPRLIDTELECLGVGLQSPDYFRSGFEFDFGGGSNQHIHNDEKRLFKCYGQMSSDLWKQDEDGNSSLQQDCSVSLPYAL